MKFIWGSFDYSFFLNFAVSWGGKVVVGGELCVCGTLIIKIKWGIKEFCSL